MRILFTIHHELDPDAGAPGVTVALAQALRAEGHESAILSWSDLPARLGHRERELLFPSFVAGRIHRDRHELDVVDASSCDAWQWLAAREVSHGRRRGPVVVTRTHGLEHTFLDARRAQALRAGTKPPLLQRVYHDHWRLRESEVSLRLADAVLFLNRADRERAVTRLGVRPERTHLVANGVPDALVRLPAPREAEPDTPLRLVHLGSWDPRKGIEVTAAALGPLLAAGTDVELSLLGTGVGADQVLGAFPTAARERISVVPRYRRDELPALLGDRHVLLLPSLAEGSSLALVEGMACGLAPVATTVGAAPDLLTDGDDGVLVAPGDADALRAAVARLAADRPLVERLRRAAHARAQTLSWSRVASDLVDLYDEARRART